MITIAQLMSAGHVENWNFYILQNRYGGGLWAMCVPGNNDEEYLAIPSIEDLRIRMMIEDNPWCPIVFGSNYDEVMLMLHDKIAKHMDTLPKRQAIFHYMQVLTDIEDLQNEPPYHEG